MRIGLEKPREALCCSGAFYFLLASKIRLSLLRIEGPVVFQKAHFGIGLDRLLGIMIDKGG